MTTSLIRERLVARTASLAWPGLQRSRRKIGYKRWPGSYGCKPSVVIDNTLSWQFDVDALDRAWVTNITYIRLWKALPIWPW